MTDKELKDLVASLAVNSAKTDVQLAKTEELLHATIKRLDSVGRQLGDIGHSNGDMAEELFFNSLENDKQLGNIKFDEIFKNIHSKRKRTEDEFDILLENGNAVGIVEVKYKVKKDHIDNMFSRKALNLRILFPEYEDFKLYMGIAGLSFEDGSEAYAIEQGLVVLKQKGDSVQINSDNMMAF